MAHLPYLDPPEVALIACSKEHSAAGQPGAQMYQGTNKP